jgi:tetratricopeptide (TPR) repeat protein
MTNFESSIIKRIFKKRLFLLVIVIQSLTVYSQVPPEEFFKGLDLLSINKQEAKKEFLIAHKKDSLFHGTYHFLGVIYLAEKQPDSAIYCFKKSIALNKENINHTKEMAYVRLIDTYLYQRDFNNSFSIAWDAYLQYPDNNAIKLGLQDACLWSFYINHNNLDPSYLSPDLKDEYLVNSVDEEYLIIRWTRINDQYLSVSKQSLINKKKVSYDILKCSLSDSNESVEVKFKLNWDLNKYFGGKVVNANDVYSDSGNPIYERIGALLASDPKIDLNNEINKLIK